MVGIDFEPRTQSRTDGIRNRGFGTILYFISATLSFYFVYDKRAMKHPKFLRNQISLEIKQAMHSMPGMAVLTALCFVAEVRGYTKLYDFPEEGPFALYTYLQYPLFIAFTDCGIYFIHRGLHHPWVYKHLHKAHHKWIVSTPFASYAFHPVDGFSQSFPYHLYPFLFPLQKIAYLALFVFVTIWTVMIREHPPLPLPVQSGSADLTRRWGVCPELAGGQRLGVPYHPPLLLQLQLRPVHHPVGPPGRKLPQAEPGAL